MDLIERIVNLERADLFAHVQAECLARAALAMEEESVPAAHPLYGAGDPAACLYLLCEGTVRLELGGRTWEVGPGECFGYEEVLAEDERRHSAQTLSPCLLLKLERGEALRLMAEDPGLARGAIRAQLARQMSPDRSRLH